MTEDPLLDAILAAPDDDAPRLVWADREGGVRGELVVVQCRIASGKGTPELVQRERELVTACARGRDFGERCYAYFTRGFAEHLVVPTVASLAARLDELLALAPALRSIQIEEVAPSVREHSRARESWQAAERLLREVFERLPRGQVLALIASPEVAVDNDFGASRTFQFYADPFVQLIADAPALSELRSLTMTSGGLSPAALPALARMKKLEHLVLGESRLGPNGFVPLLRALPGLRRLTAKYGQPALSGEQLAAFVCAPEFEQLTELGLVGSKETKDRGLIEELPPELRKIVRWD